MRYRTIDFYANAWQFVTSTSIMEMGRKRLFVDVATPASFSSFPSTCTTTISEGGTETNTTTSFIQAPATKTIWR
jgi:hypothetical protein